MPNNTKQTILKQLSLSFPHLIIHTTYDGYVINIVDDTVFVRLSTEDGEQYDCDIEKSLFPPDDLHNNICFFLVLGEINKKLFKQINYFYWDDLDIEHIKEDTQYLLDIFSKGTKNKIAE